MTIWGINEIGNVVSKRKIEWKMSFYGNYMKCVQYLLVHSSIYYMYVEDWDWKLQSDHYTMFRLCWFRRQKLKYSTNGNATLVFCDFFFLFFFGFEGNAERIAFSMFQIFRIGNVLLFAI